MSGAPEYLLIPEAAAIARASPATVRYWIATGRLRHVRPGRRVLIRSVDLIAFIESSGEVDGAAAADERPPRRSGGR